MLVGILCGVVDGKVKVTSVLSIPTFNSLWTEPLAKRQHLEISNRPNNIGLFIAIVTG